MNRGLTLALAALTAASTGLIATPAAAAVPLSTVCATGAITEFAGGVDALGQPTASVSGWMQPCAPAVLPDEFTVIYYNEKFGVVTPSRTLPFKSANAPTPFSVTATYQVRPEGAGGPAVTALPLAICAAQRNLGRVDCVRVDFRGAAQAPLISRIPIDDPLVRKIAFYGQEENTQHGCGNCV